MAPLRNLLTGVLLTTGCVFPSQDPTGIELSWLFMESNVVDGEDTRLSRTCVGATAEHMTVTITDQGDEDRTRGFPFACEQGFQTVEQFQIEPSDVFIPLRPGVYDVDVQALSAANVALVSQTHEITVRARGIAVHALDLPLPSVPWTVELTGLDACVNLTLSLLYADPAEQLTEVPSAGSDGGGPEDTDGAQEGDRVLYRKALLSDAGLPLGGTESACDALSAGTHLFADVDVGTYVLMVDRDGSTCPLSLRIDRPKLVFSLDLANLPCPG